MHTKILIVGAAAIGLMTTPALAQSLGSSGNMGGLLGGLGGQQGSNWGGSKGGQNSGGQNGGSNWNQSSNSSKAYNNNSQTDASKQSGSQYKESSFNLRDTTLGGVYANPQVDSSQVTKSFSADSQSNQGGGSKHGGGSNQNSSSNSVQGDASKKTFSASFPVAVESTTIGGFSSHKESGKTWDNRNYSNKESTSYKATQSQQSSSNRH